MSMLRDRLRALFQTCFSSGGLGGRHDSEELQQQPRQGVRRHFQVTNARAHKVQRERAKQEGLNLRRSGPYYTAADRTSVDLHAARLIMAL